MSVVISIQVLEMNFRKHVANFGTQEEDVVYMFTRKRRLAQDCIHCKHKEGVPITLPV